MFQTLDVYRQFADFFQNKNLEPFLYLLSKRFSEGHICLDLADLDATELEEAGITTLPDTAKLKDEPLVFSVDNSEEQPVQPFVLWENRLYMQRYFHYESLVFDKIKQFIFLGKADREALRSRLIVLKPHLQRLFPVDTLDKPDWQMIAAIAALFNRFTIITGGPGTGKTTTVAKILSLLLENNPSLKVALAAPTGKAAARMAESLKETANNPDLGLTPEIQQLFTTLEPSTIHRLLGARPDNIYFRHNAQLPIPHDLVIVDESSMIDVAMFAKLLDAIRPEAKVIFLGDKDQLASVEAGSLFGDLCTAQKTLNTFRADQATFINENLLNYGKTPIPDVLIQENDHLLAEHIVELQHSYRFTAGGNIGVISDAIIHNKTEVLTRFIQHNTEDIRIDTEYSEAELLDFASQYQSYIEEPNIREALKKLNNFRVLCAVREGPQGLYHTNSQIEKHLQQKGLLSLTQTYYENRPIIVTSNNYELGLFNGDIGLVRKDENNRLRVWFETADGELRNVLPAFIQSAETVFAMTIHKSQGSEFDHILVRLPEYEANRLLTRELLYTGVTRAKKTVIIQASEAVMLSTCENRVKRGSGILQRFKTV